MMDQAARQLLRGSVVWVWLSTAGISLWERHGQSAALLHSAGLQDPQWIAALIGAGASLDVVLGLAMWFRPGRASYLAALLAMLIMTMVATLLLPGLWLHPLGPLTKNVPMVVVLALLARQAK